MYVRYNIRSFLRSANSDLQQIAAANWLQFTSTSRGSRIAVHQSPKYSTPLVSLMSSEQHYAIDLLASFLEINDKKPSTTVFTTLSEAVQRWFPCLHEEMLRRILSQAMRSEEEGRRSVWSLIIDSIREETTRRQQLAPNTIRELLEACQMDRLEATTLALRSQNRIDYIVISQFKLMREQAEGNHDQTLITILEHILAQLQPSPSSSTSLKQDNQEIPVEALVEAGEYLQSLLKQSNGDANKLCIQLQQDYEAQGGRFHATALLRVLDDNIEACRSAGYSNKLKLFIFIKVMVILFIYHIYQCILTSRLVDVGRQDAIKIT